MNIGIGVSLNSDARVAAYEAFAQASRAVSRATLAMVFGSIHLDQKEIYTGLIESGIDPSIIVGGSSYAEISPAGVTYHSLVVLLLELPEARINTVSVPLYEDPLEMSRELLNAFGDQRLDDSSINLGLLVSAISPGRENEMLASLRKGMSKLAVFGGMSCGNYDMGMSRPEFWENYQYCGGAFQKQVRMALLQLPRSEYNVAFGLGHGWEPLGPTHTVTRSEGATVFEIDGMPTIEFYRRFLGRDADEHFFELLIQRYGLALQMDESNQMLTKVKTPVQIDRKGGSMTFYPFENLQGCRVNLIQANRRCLIAGARQAAMHCIAALDGERPVLVLVVSCSQRGAILHSQSDAEIEAVRSVIGRDVPVLGWYSGGEIVPFLNRYDDVIDENSLLQGTGFHGTTIGLLALTSKKEVTKIVVPKKIDRKDSGRSIEQLLKQSEETLDSTEAFLSNLSRQVYHDGERLKAQSDVLHRYTPHEVWNQARVSAEKGEYEIANAEFNGAYLFMDIQGFTSYSEKHSPEEVVHGLNSLFEPATAIIYECGGDVDKYMGDCIFAAFQDKEMAVEAGRQILTLFNMLRAEGNPFNVRIGINAGRAIRANVGGVNRREYTFIGDAVNLTQRLESHCTPGKMLLSEIVYNHIADKLDVHVKRRIITVKGKLEPLSVYECTV